MAHVMLMPKGMAPFPHVYLTDFGVGAGQPNKRDDVLLVQFFLAALSADPLRKDGRQFSYQDKKGTYYDYTVAGQGAVKIDGVCGNQTIAYIKRFQTEGSKTAAPGTDLKMLADGVITPSKAGVPWNRFGQVLSIIRLNGEYSSMYGPNRLASLATEPLFPGELLKSFYQTF